MTLWRVIIEPSNESRFEQARALFLDQRQQAVSNYKDQASQQLNSIATQAQTLRVFTEYSQQVRDNSGEDLAALKQDMLSKITGAKRIALYLPGQAQQAKDAGGSIGFIELDMVNRAEKNVAAFPEVAKTADKQSWEIHWATPVFPQENGQALTSAVPLGVIYATTPIATLTEAVANYDTRLARVELSQKIGARSILRFFTTGDSRNHFGSFRTRINNSHWAVEVWPSQKLYRQAVPIPLWFIALIVILTFAGVYLGLRIAQHKNKQFAALYQTLDFNLPGQNNNDDEKDERVSEEKLSDPLYLADQQVVIDEADQALIDGTHQQRQDNTDAVAGQQATTISGNANPAAAMAVPPHIFRAYDIRGLVDSELTDDIARVIGQAVASEALEQGEKVLHIGFDARTHSPRLCEQLIAGVRSSGCDAINIGLVPTPLMNFATHFSDQSNSGIIVTASHNPKTYNGFKIVINGRTLVAQDMQDLQQRINQGILTQGKTGKLEKADLSEDYIDTILADIAINSDLKIVIDASNGAASELAPRLFNELGCQVTPLFCEFDGNFPNHNPDPSVEANLQALIAEVKSTGADLGLALDGDGDRLVVITASGQIIWPDQLLMLFARDVVSRNPGCDVIFDIKSTRQLNQVVSSYGGRPVMWKTGHSHIKAKLEETGALLAGEFSGHIFFKERWFGFDDGLYAAARLLEMMSLRDQSLDDMLAAMPTMVATPEIKLPIDESKKQTFIQQLIEEGDFAGGEPTTIDGLRIDFDKGWGLVRASNTGPALTLRFEAENQDGVEQLKALFKRELQKIDSSLALDF